MKEQADSFILTIATQKSQPSPPPAPLNNMDFGRMHEIMASVSGYLVHFRYLLEIVHSGPFLPVDTELLRSRHFNARTWAFWAPVLSRNKASYKNPEKWAKNVAGFLQKCSRNLRFHL